MSKLDQPFTLPPQTATVPAQRPQNTRVAGASFASRITQGDSSRAEAAPVSSSEIVELAMVELSGKSAIADDKHAFHLALFASEQHHERSQLQKQVDLFKDNPFGPPDPHDLEAIATLTSQSDPSSMNSRMLRLQYRMQRESLRYSFASNTHKSDHDDRKSILSNIR